MTMEVSGLRLRDEDMYGITRTWRSSGQSLDYHVDDIDHDLISFDSHIRHRFAQIHGIDLLTHRLDYLDRLNGALTLAATFGLYTGLRNELGHESEFMDEAEVNGFNDAITNGNYWIADIMRNKAAKLVELTATPEYGVQPILQGRHGMTGFAPVTFKPTAGLMDETKNIKQ